MGRSSVRATKSGRSSDHSLHPIFYHAVLIPPDDILSPGGPIAEALSDDFEPRQEQLRMADAVARAMQDMAHLLVEAGTGVGKSFAYLVPAIIRAMFCGEVVLVSTHTISLQEQLIEKDIPLIANALEIVRRKRFHDNTNARALSPLLVKGRGNYVSLRRLELASSRQDRLFGDPALRRSLHVIEDWASTTEDGSTATLPQLERWGVWDKVQSDAANCMGKRCKRYDACFYQNARAKLTSANLLVCNHALFFSDLALRGQDVGFLPRYHHVVLDEAHTVEDVASDHFGVSLAEGRVNHLLTTLFSPRQLKGYLPQLSSHGENSEEVDKAIALVETAIVASRAFFDSWLSFARSAPKGRFGASDGPTSARVRERAVVDDVLSPTFSELSLRLMSLRESVKRDEDKFELNAYAIRAKAIAQDAKVLVEQSLPGCTYWVEAGKGEEDDAFRGPRVTVACAPIEVGPILKEKLFSNKHSVTLTSATLSTRTVQPGETIESAETAFAHVLSRLGCEGARVLQLGSPFDYARQVTFHVGVPREQEDRPNNESVEPLQVTDAQEHGSGGQRFSGSRHAKDNDSPGESRWPASRGSSVATLCDQIMHHVRATDGGAFVLFTSFSMLNACAERLEPELERLGMPLLAQGRNGSRSYILQKFKENERSVLFGAASFWQGVDVRGRGLRNVIITRLPFEPPDRPLTEARCDLIQSRGGNPFMEDALPRAVIRFKQGFGRLIRGKNDQGRVVVLDERIVTARYGRVFLSALPKGVQVV